MFKRVIYFTPERWQYWTSLIGRTYTDITPAESGTKNRAYSERRRVVSVAPYGDRHMEVVTELA